MQQNRNIRVSIREHIKSALAAPGVCGPQNAYNVYGENNLPDRAPTFSPVYPYVYLVDSFIEPTKPSLPLMVVEVNPITLSTAELGRQSRVASVYIHVFGRNRGERDDLSSYLQDWLATSGSGNRITVRDYGVSATPIVDYGWVTGGVEVNKLHNTDEFAEEASLLNWNAVWFQVRFTIK